MTHDVYAIRVSFKSLKERERCHIKLLNALHTFVTSVLCVIQLIAF